MSILLVGTLINIRRGHHNSGQRPSCSVVHFPSRGGARWVGGRRWPLSRRRQTKGVSFYFLFFIFFEEQAVLFFRCIVFGFSLPLGMLVAKREPTPCYHMRIRWALLNGHYGRKAGETTFSPRLGRFFLVSKRTFYFFWGVIRWMLHIGRARHPGPGPRNIIPGQLSIEFINIGGWLTSGDFAMDSFAQFLAVAEHRLIPSRARSICHQLRMAGHHSVWAPACQDKIAGGHAGVGALPSFVTPQFQEFFRLGRVLTTTLPTAQGGVVHFFVVFCVGQPMLIAGDLNADPAVIPCLAKGISAGRYVDLALAYSLGAGLTPDIT